MKSIRSQLLSRLLPGFFVLWVGAGIAIYQSAGNSWERRLESDLREIAAVLPLGSPWQIDSYLSLDDIAEGDVGIYFQIWGKEGERLLKSRSLGQFDLERPGFFSRKGEFRNQIIGGGDRVKTLAIHINDLGGLGDIDLMVAKSRDESIRGMTRVGLTILAFGLGGVGLFALILVSSLKSSLRPLDEVGNRALLIDADSIRSRFSNEDLPSELTPIVDKLNDLLSRLELSIERERRFSDDLAHEFRTPVAALRSIAEGALEWPDGSAVEDFRDIKAISEELQFTIENMLTLARIEKRKSRISRQPVFLRELVEECWKLCAGSAAVRNVSIRIDLPRDQMMVTDPNLLRVLVSNLISNSVEYTPRGTEIAICPANDHTFFSIRNPAPNLNHVDLPLLFDRLWRHDDARIDSSHCGLGLAVASACADALSLKLEAWLDDEQIVSFTLSEKSVIHSSSKQN